MKKSILLLFVTALTMGVCARSVSPRMAVAAADAWAQRNVAFKAGTAATGDVITERDPANASVVLWHQVSMEGGGMIVVAPVTEIEPVIVALDRDPGSLPQAHPLRGILTGDMRRRLTVMGLYPAASLMRAAPAAAAALSFDEVQAWGEANRAKWDRLTGGSGASLMAAAGLREITTDICTVKGFGDGENGYLRHWNQGGYNGAYLYNLHTPGHSVCGCVATACAALAQFYGTTNSAAVSKTCSYNDIPDTYSTRPGPIDWSILPSNWGGTNEAVKATDKLTADQQELLGSVAYNAGVGVRMDWKVSESGATEPSIVTALKEVFGFRHATAVFIDPAKSPDEEQLSRLMYNQLRAGVPVGMSIKGHSVVAVGYGLDSDNVERVRVFMGWGGAGDGWYALPKIDTKATMNGGSYLSEIVDCIITMIAYDNDDIVPVVGHVSMPGAALEIPALNRVIESSEYGYFGTRVPADLAPADCVITCMGKEATFEIGDVSGYDAAELTEALPGAFEFALLNSTVAYSLARAKLLATREGKAILRVSGMSSDTNVSAVLDYIYDIDKDNTDDFTNKFVYIFSSSSSSAGDGANVSYGVYLPTELEPEQRWQIGNGALTYGYLSLTEKATNDTHNADHAVTEWATTNAFTYTFAPRHGVPEVTTNAAEEVEEIRAAVLESFKKVLEIGAQRHAECTSGIEVTVTATSEAAEAAMGTHDGSYPDGAYDKCGFYAGCFAPGSDATFVCNAEVTNATDGVVFGCAGWTLSVTNVVTGGPEVTEEGTGANVLTRSFAAGDRATLEWDLSEVTAVRLTVQWNDADLVPDAVTPGTGWYPAGAPVVFTAIESADGWNFSKFISETLPDGSIVLSPFKVLVPTTASGVVEAVYRKNGTLPEAPEVAGTCAVTIHNYVWNVEDESVGPADDLVPDVQIYTCEGVTVIANGETADVPGAPAGVTVTATAYTNGDGVEMEFMGLMVGTEINIDEPLPVAFDFADMNATTIQLVWKPVGQSIIDAPIPTEFSVEWDDALSVLDSSGFSTNLLTKAQLEKYGIKIDDVTISAPRGFKAVLLYDDDGNLCARLDLDEPALKPVGEDGVSSPLTIVPNEGGSVTVRADVKGVMGFWYTLYGSDNLVDWSPVTTGYEAGIPCDQAKADDVIVPLWITIEPNESKRFFKLVVTEKKP